MRESAVESLFVQLAEADGWEVRKLTWPGRRGAPDRIIMRGPAPPALVFVELKAPKGRLSVTQKREHARLRAMGFRVVVLWSCEMVREWFA